MGLFLDMGVYANYNFLVKYKEKDKFTNYTYNAKYRTITYKKLDYTLPYHYGFHTRLGLNRLSIAAEYRLSPLIKNFDTHLPPLWFEIQVGLHP